MTTRPRRLRSETARPRCRRRRSPARRRRLRNGFCSAPGRNGRAASTRRRRRRPAAGREPARAPSCVDLRRLTPSARIGDVPDLRARNETRSAALAADRLGKRALQVGAMRRRDRAPASGCSAASPSGTRASSARRAHRAGPRHPAGRPPAASRAGRPAVEASASHWARAGGRRRPPQCAERARKSAPHGRALQKPARQQAGNAGDPL